MSLFHRHKWKVEAAQRVHVYGDGWGGMTKYPSRFETHFLLRCEGCGDVKSKTVRGSFALAPEDAA